MINSNNILSNISSGSHSSLWDEVAAIISGLIGGGLYGLKIRIPHSFGERGCDDDEASVIFSLNILIEILIDCIFSSIIRCISDDISIWESSILTREIKGRCETCGRACIEFSGVRVFVQGVVLYLLQCY